MLAQTLRGLERNGIVERYASGGPAASGLRPDPVSNQWVETPPAAKLYFEAPDLVDWFEFRPMSTILLTMSMPASTPVPISEAKTHLSDLARRVRLQHERITLTRNGEPEAVLVSVDDLEGLEMTLEILGDSDAVGRISESLAALGRGEPGVDLATVRADLARRRLSGT
jgi:antitoxin YefM